MLKVYTAEYNHYWGGECDHEHLTIVAGSESEALGLALMHYTRTGAEDWEIEEVDTSVEGTH